MNTIGIDNNLDRPRIKKLLVIGLFASFLTGIGDFMLGYGTAENMGNYGLPAGVLASAPNLADGQLIVFWLPMMIIQFKAFSKGFTPYPGNARWFCVLIGMIPAIVLSAIVGPYSALGSAIGTMFLSFGNAFLFGGLLATLPEQEVFEAFESSLHQSSEGR